MPERRVVLSGPALYPDPGGASNAADLAEPGGLRKRIEQLERHNAALQVAAERYRSWFNSIDSGFCIIEVLLGPTGAPADYRFLEVNAAFEEQTGLRDAVGKRMRELAPGHEQHWFEIYGHVALSGHPVRFQNRAAALGRWYDVFAFRVGHAADCTVGIFFSDITARKRAEERLREREQQLHFITNNLPMLIVHCDAETRYKFVNTAYAEHLGIDPGKALGKKIAEVIGGPAFKAIRKHVEAALHGDRVEFEEVIPYENIGQRWIHGIYVPERALDGSVIGFVAVIQEITTRKKAEQALGESESRFRALMEQAPFSIQVFAPDGRTVRVNRAWEELWGVTLEQISEYNVLRDPQLEAKGISSYIQRAFAGEAVEIPAVQYDPNITIPNRTRHADPVRWVSAVAYPLHDRAGHIREVVLVHQDITHRKRAEEALAKTQQELQRYAVNLEETVADRTAKLRETVHDLESFSYSIAHDMRAPLRAMRGFAGILQEDYASRLDATAISYLQRISAAALRLDHLIVDILDYSKIVRGELKLGPVDLHKLAREVLSSYPQFDSSRTDITIEGPLPIVIGNHAALTQVMSNLLTNAIKFVAPGQRPRVRVRAERVEDHPSFRNGSARVWIEDNGIGIPPHARDKLFDIFTRFENPDLYEGTGIGLAIVKKAVERMSGLIGVESKPGHGSRFWFQLGTPSGSSER